MSRLPDTFTDPVLRLRAWYWLARVSAISELDHLALDKSALAPGLVKSSRFRSIWTDGFDPDRTGAKDNLSLVSHVGNHPAFRSTYDDYWHPLWRVLRHRQPSGFNHAQWIATTLRKLKIVPILSKDCSNALDLRLDWPLFPLNREAVVFSLGELTETAQPLLLDDLLLRVLYYRQCIDRGEFEMAGELQQEIRVITKLTEKLFHDEGVDTWRYIVRTRMLTWQPHYRPSDELVRKTEQEIFDAFADQPKTSGRGRAPKSPDKSKGQTERRWRRRALMKACAVNVSLPEGLRGFQRATPFNEWLVANRKTIPSYIQAGYDMMLFGEIAPRDERLLFPEVPTLEIPVDDEHRIVTTGSTNSPGNGFSDPPTAWIPLVYRKVGFDDAE